MKSVGSYLYWLPCQQPGSMQQQRQLPLVRIRWFLLLVLVGFGFLPLFHLMLLRQPVHLRHPQPTTVPSSHQNASSHRPSSLLPGSGDGLLSASEKTAIGQHRKDAGPKANSSSSSFKSSCSWAADGRGHHQKVIGYSIYGDFSQTAKAARYLEPLKEILESIPSAHPGWIVRIHHNLKREERQASPWKMLEKAVAGRQHVDLCNVSQIAVNRKLGPAVSSAMLWRWLPLLDDLVDAFMSRDADSLILAREQDAVAEWLASNHTFHIMRDHPAHCIVMLGGLWGVKLGQDRPKIRQAFESLFRKERNYSNAYFLDQNLLKKYIWPLARANQMAHDSYCCQKFKGTRPFPTQRSRQMHFVGQVKQKNQLIKSPCPKQCRPLHVNPEWKYC